MVRDRLPASERARRGIRVRPGRIAGYIAPATSTPKAPAGLGPAAKRAWRSTWDKAHWLTPLDVLAVTLFCRELDELHALDAILEADGRMATGSKGQPVVHPAVTQRRASLNATMAIAERHGLTATGRRRRGIETQAPAPIAEMDRLLDDLG